VGVAGRKVCADGVGRFGREAEGSPLASDGMVSLDDGRCVGVAACATCAESGVGRFGEEGKFSSSDSGGAFIDEGRSDVGVGRRADESKDEEGRMDVAVGRSVVEDGLEDDEEAEAGQPPWVDAVVLVRRSRMSIQRRSGFDVACGFS